jgi:hypothetical protein
MANAEAINATAISEHLRRAYGAAQDAVESIAQLRCFDLGDETNLLESLKRLRAASTYAAIVTVNLADARKELTALGGR